MQGIEKCPCFIGKAWGEQGFCGALIENVWPKVDPFVNTVKRLN